MAHMADYSGAILPGSDAHDASEDPRHMRLVGETCGDSGFCERRIGGQQRPDDTHLALCVIGVRCHANSTLESAQQSKRCKTGLDGEDIEGHFVGQAPIEIGAGASYGDRFRCASGHAIWHPSVTLQQLGNQCEQS